MTLPSVPCFPARHGFFARLCLAFVLCLAGASGAVSVESEPLSESDARIYRQAFSLLEKKRAEKAYRHAQSGRHPLPKKVLRWYYLYKGGAGAGFEEISAFVEQNPGWPFTGDLRRRAEETIPASVSDQRVLDHFRRFPPITLAGAERFAQVLKRTGDVAGADEQIRRAWSETSFAGRRGHTRQRRFLRRYKRTIRAQDHFARAEKLLWKNQTNNAVRFLSEMAPADKAVVVAWTRLMRRRSSQRSITDALARIPAARKNHPGVLYGKLRRLTKREQDGAARAVVQAAPAELGNPEAWWVQRNLLARRAIEDRDFAAAYVLANNNGLKRGKYFAEAEFLAGWVALRFLNDPDAALVHFTTLHNGVRYPISLARGAYWRARAYEAKGDTEKAVALFETAARHVGTYYGHLAALKLGPRFQPRLPEDIDPAFRNAFEQSELVRAIRMLDDLGAERFQPPLLMYLFKSAENQKTRALTTELALSLNHLRTAVRISKKANQSGDSLIVAGYPVLPIPQVKSGKVNPPEDALLLSVIRQESQFHAAARSSAGARGLMQLMPRTARITARKIRVRYIRNNLTRKPDYNIRLGRAYLSGMLADYDGHYALALAAYNAGPHRVDRWLALYGDPRGPSVDVLDWIEMIPFRETRNYVQRVLENLVVYRWRLGKAGLVPTNPGQIYTSLAAVGPNHANGLHFRPITASTTDGPKPSTWTGNQAAESKARPDDEGDGADDVQTGQPPTYVDEQLEPSCPPGTPRLDSEFC